jgi:hypothetical protein
VINRNRLTSLETKLLHALQFYTRETDADTILLRVLKIQNARRKKKPKQGDGPLPT